MSTAYYEVAEPFTSIRVIDSKDGKYVVRLWLNKQWSGTIMVKKEELADVVRLFRGAQVGLFAAMELTKEKEPRTPCLISEYGDVLSVGQLLDECRNIEGATINWEIKEVDWQRSI